ncbi:MAG TPA: lysozyme inhibitor LprI family protein [Stellaceae bacterium]
MLYRRLTIVLLLSLLGAAPAFAAAPDCANAETQAALDLCAGKALRDADRALDRVRKALNKELSDPLARAALAQAEKSWDAYRDAECRFESSGIAGGSAEHMVIAYCQAQRARTRMGVLKRILDCKEGDLTCPTLTR